jgi:hypothetical protein
MTKWEYATVPLLPHNTKQILDNWGDDGWEPSTPPRWAAPSPSSSARGTSAPARPLLWKRRAGVAVVR